MHRGKVHTISVRGYSNEESHHFELLDSFLSFEDYHQLDFVPWEQFPYQPEVKFKIAYTDLSVLLKVYVNEKFIKADYSRINDPVYKDSCFEFFISPDNNQYYYNFEFNCIGTPYVAYGDKENREKASVEIVKSIQTFSSLGSVPFEEKQGDFFWELCLSIPFTAFFKHELESLKGKTCKANFHKCGDGLTQKHFLSWNNIDTETPDFHCPEFFGELIFTDQINRFQ
jgi:cellulose/xylan binding protein with CBM9 domain